MNNDTQIMKRAVRLFPRSSYTPDSAVRHARRQWLRCVEVLRSGQHSKWVMDRSAELAPLDVAS
jgi:hypothetical protein